MGTIREKMTPDLELRGFASTTKKEHLQRWTALRWSQRSHGRSDCSLPDILTGEEVERIFQQIASLKHRAILMVAYDAEVLPARPRVAGR